MMDENQPKKRAPLKGQNQELLIDDLQKRSRKVTVFLKNGVHVQGIILAHDPYTILMETDKNRVLIYKHTVTSINTR
jgi:RNA chaperone Hfq